MKRIAYLLVAAMIVSTFAACGSSNAIENAEKSGEDTAAITDDVNDNKEEARFASDGADSKTLIVYYSPANADRADAISSATPRVGDVSSVEYVAEIIGGQIDADVAKIVPTEPYPLEYEETAEQARAEQAEDERPGFSVEADPEDYDVIFVGYPIWYFHLPMIMQTFFDEYDFSGKTVIPFNTHAGSRDGGTYKDIAELELGATVLEGLAVEGESVDRSGEEIKAWLSELYY